MTKFDLAWLDYAYDMMRDRRSACTCEPYANGAIRWPGYMGSDYSGVLFVGARHNASGLLKAGLRKAGRSVGPLGRYVEELRSWMSQPRTVGGDRRLLEAMRHAYRHSYDVWSSGSVWKIFLAIRDSIGLTWDNIASVNLARCYQAETNTGEDDKHILSHAEPWPLDRIVTALQPKIVFISKDKDDAELRAALSITGENREKPLVIRYSNYGTGMRNKEPYTVWIAAEAAKWRSHLQ